MTDSKHGYKLWNTDSKEELMSLQYGMTNITKELFHQLNLEKHFYYIPASKRRYVINSKDSSKELTTQYLVQRGKVLRNVTTKVLINEGSVTVYLDKRWLFQVEHHSYKDYFKSIESLTNISILFKSMRHYEKDLEVKRNCYE